MQLTAPVESYTAEFVELDPEDSQFTTDLDNPSGDGNLLEVDPEARGRGARGARRDHRRR